MSEQSEPKISQLNAIEYENGFLAACEAHFDHLPEPACPYEAGSVFAEAWHTGVADAQAILKDADHAPDVEVF